MNRIEVPRGPETGRAPPHASKVGWPLRVAHTRSCRALIWGLISAALVLLVLAVRFLASGWIGNSRAGPFWSTFRSADPEPTAIEWVRRGHQAIQRRCLRDAEDAFERAKRLDPKLAPARVGLIWIHALRVERTEALNEFAALAELGPLEFDQALLWCQIHCSTWDLEKVFPQIRELLEADPGDRKLRLTLAEVCRRLGRQSEALETLKALDETDPDALAIRARLAIDQGQPSAAEALLSRGPANHPDLADVRGQIALFRHDAPTAVDSFRLALAGEPDNRGRLHGLAQALRLSGQHRAAEPLLEQIRLRDTLINRVAYAAEMTHNDELPLLRNLGAACEALGLSAEARAWYDLALAQAPLDRETLVALRRLRASRSKYAP
jgi:tetratricopeptide (TPR) repeat protein